eukprot:GHRR01033815.1.p1 GENE.GHRR01033815.1~~GHRR01033815.1.p1  ORF type:complete len:104 (-),score=18.46 GHRR01033815.1:242-553(-)
MCNGTLQLFSYLQHHWVLSADEKCRAGRLFGSDPADSAGLPNAFLPTTSLLTSNVIGEFSHCQSTTHLFLLAGVPVVFGVLTCDTMEQVGLAGDAASTWSCLN